jgi:predicted nuclease of predicted toxin-antitoxin system
MKFLADINIPQSVINALLTSGHDLLDLKKKNLTLPDTEVIQLAKREGRIILTRDKDFLGLTQFPKYQVPTIVIRLKIQTPQHITNRLLEFLENQSTDILKTSLSIIRENSADSHPYS